MNPRMRRFNCLGFLSLTLWCAAVFHSVQAANAQALSSTVTATEVRQSIARVRSSDASDSVVEQALSIGGLLLRDGRFVEATELFTALAEKKPLDPGILYGQALAMFNSGRVADAEPVARKAMETATAAAQPFEPNNREHSLRAADALVLLSIILAVRGDDAAALKFVQQAVRLVPDHFDAQLSLGRLLFGMGDNSGATKAFRKAKSLQPSNSQALFFLATALERSGEIEAALSTYRELIAVKPNAYEGHLGLGVLLLKRGGARADEGLKELERALQINPNLYEAHVEAGRALIASGRALDAIEHLRRAAELAPENPEPHYQLSLAYRRLGQKNEAAEQSAIVKRINDSRRSRKATTVAP